MEQNSVGDFVVSQIITSLFTELDLLESKTCSVVGLYIGIIYPCLLCGENRTVCLLILGLSICYFVSNNSSVTL